MAHGSVKKGKFSLEAAFWLILVHVAALAAIPFFSWPALGVCLLLLFTISPLGVTLTYHRLLTHRSFKVPKWLEYIFATIGALSAQGSPMLWVAEHRLHHKYSDTPNDPHSPLQGFFHAHIGHLFYVKDHHCEKTMLRYVPDLNKQAYYRFLHKYNVWIALSILPILYLVGGWSFVLWGGFVRAALMLHITWFVNSATHTWGYRNYETRDQSRNLWWVALLSAGEGWHNNHHAQPNSAAHGQKWWEFDLTYMIIRSLGFFGLATNVIKPVLAAPRSAEPNLLVPVLVPTLVPTANGHPVAP